MGLRRLGLLVAMATVLVSFYVGIMRSSESRASSCFDNCTDICSAKLDDYRSDVESCLEDASSLDEAQECYDP